MEPLATPWLVRDPPEMKHAPVFRYNRFFRPMFEKFMGEDMTVLAVMREPIDWLGSWYRYRQRPFLDGHRTSTQGISFDEFVLAYLKGNRPAICKCRLAGQVHGAKPQRHSGHASFSL